MIQDKFLEMSAGQTVTTSGNNASTSYVDTLAAGDAISPGARVKARIATAYVDAAGGTLYAKLQTCAESTFTVPTDLLTGPTITIAAGAATAAGAVGVVLLDHVIPAKVLRYLRILYVLSADMDAGAVDGCIVLDTAKTMDKQL
ncbi:hypothetical protein D4R71_00340 [bacterium]|nr:MAG: hypothetical protein D4R71_00340 [bacterium]